jgi:hypothetical protein
VLVIPAPNLAAKEYSTMPTGFLLRFQEHVRPATDGQRSTMASVDGQQRDGGLDVPLAATKTLTEVKREQPDADPNVQAFFAVSR